MKRKYEMSIVPLKKYIKGFEDGIFVIPENQREVKSAGFNAKAADFFADLLFKTTFVVDRTHLSEFSPTLDVKTPVAISASITQIKNGKMEVQDSQHRIRYVIKIKDGKIKLHKDMFPFNEAKNSIVNEMCKRLKKDVFTFNDLPKSRQKAILGLSVVIENFCVENSLISRSIFDSKNTCTAMTSGERQHNIHYDKPIYKLTNELVKCISDKKAECPKWFSSKNLETLRFIFTGLVDGKNGKETKPCFGKETLERLFYRMMMCSEVELVNFGRPWTKESSYKLHNNFLNSHADMTNDDVKKLINKTVKYLIEGTILLDPDCDEKGSIYYKNTNLVTSAVLLARLVKNLDSFTRHRIEPLFNLRTDEVSSAALSVCRKTNNTPYNPDYTLTCLYSICFANIPDIYNKLVKDGIIRRKDGVL